MTPVRLEPVAPRSRVRHSTTEPMCSLVGKTFLYITPGQKIHKKQQGKEFLIFICYCIKILHYQTCTHIMTDVMIQADINTIQN